MASLKGILAVYITLYHYYVWGVQEPADWAVNLAQFGVCLFFTMSGSGLSQGYQGNVDWRRFWQRRAQRIVPWFWVATLATVVFTGWPGLRNIVLNLSMLWPWLKPSGYIAAGAWAVGCEVVFYVAYWLWGALGLFAPWMGWATIAASTLFGWAVLSHSLSLAVQWATWISPLTQAVAFFAGALIVPRLTPSWLWAGLWVLLCLSVPTPWAISWLRPLLLLAGCGVVVTVAKWRSHADLLGRYSYQIYLLHPVFWFVFLS